MVLKDKPILAPLWIFRPARYLVPGSFPWGWAIGWWIVVQAIGWLEPVPDELGVQFSFQYLALQHLCAIGAQLLLPLVLLPWVPRGTPGGRLPAVVRASLGASLWSLWTFPLAFVFQGVGSAVALELARPLLWAATASWAIGGPRAPRRRWPVVVAGVPWLFAGTIGLSLVPDKALLSHVHMENIRSGMVCSGIPPAMDGASSVEWRLRGARENITPDRLRLGDRQVVEGGEPGDLRVEVRPRAIAPAPEDTTGTLATEGSEGWLARLATRLGLAAERPPDRVESLVARIPAGTDSLELLWLHALVHGAIRYQRTYFPGTPSEILERGTGDCKAFAQVFCEGARRLGIRAKVVHGLLANADGYYAHAWVTARLPDGRWMDWDPTSSWPFPDGRYLRFTAPAEAGGAFDGELAIFSLDSVSARARGPGLDLGP